MDHFELSTINSVIKMYLSHSRAAFFPYLEGCFKEVMEMSNYPAPSIKRTASAALGQMCISVHKAHVETPTAETQTGMCIFIVLTWFNRLL